MSPAISYGYLFQDALPFFDIILTNPPFGGKEHKTVQVQFVYKTSATQVLFLPKMSDECPR
ncbi:MAG UNVERIFIED_CONTAM: hypothetical protein LVR29_16365 [Microcystis novacekii LVE1205-3]